MYPASSLSMLVDVVMWFCLYVPHAQSLWVFHPDLSAIFLQSVCG